jgi:hypothetical protein
MNCHVTVDSRDTSVDTPTGYELEGRGSILGRGKTLFSIPQRPDRLWDPKNLYTMGTVGSFSGSKAARA